MNYDVDWFEAAVVTLLTSPAELRGGRSVPDFIRDVGALLQNDPGSGDRMLTVDRGSVDFASFRIFFRVVDDGGIVRIEGLRPLRPRTG